MNKKVALYVRVSTDKQTLQNQINELSNYAEKMNYEVVDIFKEQGVSGKAKNKPELLKLFKRARQKGFELVLVWSLDRFSRLGVYESLSLIKELDSYGIKFCSYTEPYLSTDNPLYTDLLLSIISWVAQQETIRLKERVKAGIERARSEGKVLGRPATSNQIKEEVLKLHEQGVSQRQIAKSVFYVANDKRKNPSVACVNKILKNYKEGLA